MSVDLLIDYISKERFRNTPDNLIFEELLSKGWRRELINQYMYGIGEAPAPQRSRLARMFTERVSQSVFLLYALLHVALLTTTALILSLTIDAPPVTSGGVFMALLVISTLMILSFLSVFIMLTLTVRRQHDLGLSAWFLLLFSIPLVGFIYLLYLLFASGDELSNKFGDAPKRNIKNFWNIVLCR
jgi:uncharacterized membrane protein YhaH (DUF805 family)